MGCLTFLLKDKEELMNVKKAAYLSYNVMTNIVVPRFESVIDEEKKKITHATLMDETEEAIVNPQLAKVKLKPKNVDICYPPIFQNGA